MLHVIVSLFTALWISPAAADAPRGTADSTIVAAPSASERPNVQAEASPLNSSPTFVAGGELPLEPATAATPSPPSATPAPACLDQTVDRIQARYDGVRDLKARFRQTSRPAHLANTAAKSTESTGHMVIAKPGKMRWTYEAPEESLVVSDGESLWLYDPAFGEAQKLPVTEGFLSGAAIEFLLGQGDMRRDFEIALESCGAERVALRLTPKEPASYEHLVIVADPRTGDLFQTQVDDLIGNSTTIVFEDLLANQNPDAATFRFEAPPGVDVIEIKAP